MNFITFITIVLAAYIFYYTVVIGLEMAGRKRVSVDSSSGKVDFVVAPVSQPVRVVSEQAVEEFEQYQPVVEASDYSRELEDDENEVSPATTPVAENKSSPFAKMRTEFGIEGVQHNYSGYKVSDAALHKHLFQSQK